MRAPYAEKALTAFEAHHERMLFAGAGNPDDGPYWEAEYRKARKRMLKHLMKEN